MTATVIVGMLCVHLLCFGAMFWLISRRLQGDGLGMDMFALGNAMLGLAYVLQLLGGAPGWSAQSVLNHTLTLCTPLVYAVGGLRFFGRPAPLLRPLLTLALVYTAAQGLAHWLLGPVARYAMLALGMALMFAAMVWALVRVMRGVGRDLRVEMALFALLIAGLGVLNAIKFVRLLQDGLPALDMTLRFQSVFYIYMSFLATVLAPAMIWLVLRRLTDALRAAAEHDPLTQLLNRRGLLAGLEAHFRSRSAGPARLLLLDIDHFKRINDGHGHKAGDLVLQRAAEALRLALRRGDLCSRTGGEEFVVVCFDASDEGAALLAERLRAVIERHQVELPGAKTALRCTVTIGVSQPFHDAGGFDPAMQEADAALYRGKAAGRNRIEWSLGRGGATEAGTLQPA
ncbi:GGDEF domain-containing protein [Melaminivora suipulveris]|uniref:diguanylate cyclase n=1 Tax=Melaminivora suipulveris TaxID=2109913 RepID=A0A2R3QGH5_9BURK|nr:GGDEF domain-containing protein [Melaminivora suipulveris]AVO50865.1 GGDEF domain-containing protein [Melaminivora suipulveris]